AFGIVILGLAVGFLVSRRIAKDIDVLDKSVKTFVANNLTQRVRVKSGGELGELASSFNKMAQRLEKSQRELELWGETLEDKVKERTQELVSANKQVENRVEELTTIFDISKTISSTLNLKELLKQILKGTAPLIGAKFGAILLVDEKSLKRCWVYQEKLGKPHSKSCDNCPAYASESLECWTISGTCCRDEIQGKFSEKITECVKCPVFQSTKLKPKAIYGVHLKDLEKASADSENCVCVRTLLELKPRIFENICENSDYETIFPKEKIQSQVCLPLVTKEKIVGVLAFATDEKGKFEKKQIRILESIAYQIAVAIENTRLYEEMSGEKIRLDAMFASMGEGVITADKNNKVVAMNNFAGEIFGVKPKDVIGNDVLLCHPKEKRDSVQELIRQFKSGESSVKEMRISVQGSRIIRVNLAPIRDKSNSFLGTVLVLQDITERERLYKKTKKAATEFSTLYEINKILGSTLELNTLLNFLIGSTAKTMGAEIGSIMLFDKELNEMRIVAAKGLDRKIVEKTRLKPGEGIAGWVFEKGEALLLEDVGTDPRFKTHEMRKELRSALSIPLKIKDEVIGVINIGSSCPQKFTDDDLRLLSTLSGEAAVSIYNAKLFNELEKLYIETVKAFVEAIEAKDSYTRGHSENVTKYAIMIANKVGFSAKDKTTLKTAALLHDIGKIGVKEDILNKPSSLTEEEYDVDKTHPHLAIQIIGQLPKLKDVVPIIFHHHERYDGNGYLKGLKGEEIPLGARILAVADSFDAMTSARPYRAPLSFQRVVKELKNTAGKQFDPYIVKVFLDVIDELGLEGLFGQEKPEDTG
ncbi:HD domain-containing phosphohydrolase, partial [Candidatus Oleimmundimicrobium sp.]|uniref:HD domain-containing phosphohydrolase n=1 Tax=Candidatus Oleimmundimicrobium sp. TaxID=3060597 RepID=UPI002717A71A